MKVLLCLPPESKGVNVMQVDLGLSRFFIE